MVRSCLDAFLRSCVVLRNSRGRCAMLQARFGSGEARRRRAPQRSDLLHFETVGWYRQGGISSPTAHAFRPSVEPCQSVYDVGQVPRGEVRAAANSYDSGSRVEGVAGSVLTKVECTCVANLCILAQYSRSRRAESNHHHLHVSNSRVALTMT